MRRVRRLAVLALASTLATTGAIGFAAQPASAHVCARAVEIPVGQPSTVAVGVTVERTAVPDVTITMPAGLQLQRVDAKAGWSITRTGPSVRFRGGPIPRFACEYFSFGVTAPGRGAFGIPLVQRSATGAVVARSTPDPASAQSRALDQFVYAGITPPSTSSGSSVSATTIAGIALVAVGTVLVGVLGVRTVRDRRGRGDRDIDDDDDDAPRRGGSEGDERARAAELRARVQRFKKRAPNPPPS
ncbi:MAG: hypothetical protein JWM72_902 [Actinomycetia bacterium]|nr:hypothetical protein [Actinomycetes bacterium]